MRLRSIALVFLIGFLLPACATTSTSTGPDGVERVEFDIGGVTGYFEGPFEAESGELFSGRICIVGGTEGHEWFATLGEPPSDERASHYAGALDSDGYLDFEMLVKWEEGVTILYTSDGENVVQVAEIAING